MPISAQNATKLELSSEKIRAERGDGVGWLIINNPERRNAISLEMWVAMSEALEQFSADPQVRCVVMKGTGEKAFASGADISQFEKIAPTPPRPSATRPSRAIPAGD